MEMTTQSKDLTVLCDFGVLLSGIWIFTFLVYALYFALNVKVC